MSKLYATKGMPVFTGFSQKYSYETSNTLLRKLSLSHAQEITNERVRSELCALLFKADFRGLCDTELDYRELNARDAYNARQAIALFSKRDDLRVGVDKTLAARLKFEEAEVSCKETNHMFRCWSAGRFQFRPRVEGILHAAQRKISDILGPVPELSELKFRFGPGSTTLRKKKDAHPSLKLGDAFSCSESFLPIAGEFLAEFPLWSGLSEAEESRLIDVEIHAGRVEFVPKNWKTDRAIVVEPMLNTMFQLGVGDFISARLRRFGVDISDQTHNQRLARYGSLTGALATLDLSSASDTISKELVAHLLPPDWFTFLSFGRTPVVMLEGKPMRQEKFSSMGNGFTFPLETLIFYALAWASCPGESTEVSAYGDDLIVPSHRFGILSEVLRCCGFTVNKGKSFCSGPFRESCGKDYLLGTDIRPFYQRGPVSCETVFLLHNYYKRRGDDLRASALVRLIAPHVRLYGPDGFGDGHLLGSWDPVPHNRGSGWGGYTFETYSSANRRSFMVGKGIYVFPSYCIYARKGLSRPVERGSSRNPDCNSSEFFGPDKDGYTRITLPGTDGYKRIKVYTF